VGDGMVRRKKKQKEEEEYEKLEEGEWGGGDMTEKKSQKE
jgi:hypothetical protein